VRIISLVSVIVSGGVDEESNEREDGVGEGK
jgi:hypothetical protein